MEQNQDTIKDRLISLRTRIKEFDEDNKWIAINPNSLDTELAGHVEGVYSHAADIVAEAQSLFDVLKDEEKTIHARTYNDIKSSGEKITEAHAASLVLASEEYQQINTLKHRGNFVLNLAKAFKEKAEARGYMLRDLARLRCSPQYA